MTATQVIEEIERLPETEQQLVFARVHELETVLIPESFLQGLAEAGRGELLDMDDADFDNPPA